MSLELLYITYVTYLTYIFSINLEDSFCKKQDYTVLIENRAIVLIKLTPIYLKQLRNLSTNHDIPL